MAEIAASLKNLSVSKSTSSDGESKSSDSTLSSQWSQAETQYQQILKSTAPASDTRKLVDSTFLLLLQIQKQVKALSLFSSNEEIDDVNTADLKYILCPFYLAELSQKRSSEPDMESRAKNVSLTMKYNKEFIDMCSQLKLLNKQDSKRYAEVRKGSTGPSFTANAMDARQEKINQAKREKEIKTKLEALQQQRTARALGDARRGNTIGKAKDADETAEEDEVEREYTRFAVEDSVQTALKNMTFLNLELQMLEMGRKQQQLQGGSGRGTSASSASPSASSSTPASDGPPKIWKISHPSQLNQGPPANMRQDFIDLRPKPKAKLPGSRGLAAMPGASALEAAGIDTRSLSGGVSAASAAMLGSSTAGSTSARPGFITASVDDVVTVRAHARANVLRDPNPPTQTLDEWVDDQQRRGLLPTGPPPEQKQLLAGSSSRRRGDDDEEEAPEAPEEREETEEESDKATYEARDWDAFTDDNEKGIGNRHRNW